MTAVAELPLPDFYDPNAVVDHTRWTEYETLMPKAEAWRRQHGLKAASTDRVRIGVLGIDVQETFCNPLKGELYVGGYSGTGAVDDCRRATEFMYRNMNVITGQHFTVDTHRAFAMFHSLYLINDAGEHPPVFTMVSRQDVLDGVWKASPFLASALEVKLMAAQAQLEFYTAELERRGRYQLTIWPFHGMLGGKGHTLVTGVEEAAFFHAVARGRQTGIEVKGTNPWVENYSVLGPEVTQLFDGTPVPRNTAFVQTLLSYDALVIWGQAKSHCVAWTIDDLLNDILKQDPELAKKVYLLEDCTTPIVIKDPAGKVIVDYGPDADRAFDRFGNAGMHVVRSTDPIASWPGIRL